MIKILDKHVADKIAAGEVVERPLSIVKELVENSIDAGASSIVVEIKNGGKSYIRVTDNGSGINANEVLLAFVRHATSKIVTDDDLERVKTLGFRGEALASIVAVSKCELITKTAESKTGVRIRIEGSEVLDNETLGCPDGTTIIISDLFYNTPARRKFTKSDATESSLIIDFISKMAIAYPEIKMRMINNDNILFSTQGKGSIKSSILTVYGGDTAKPLIPISKEDENILIKGFIYPPVYSKTNKKMQIFFVNGRSVSSKVIEKGVSDAFIGKLTTGRYPVCFLFLEIMPEKLDVNIHPNKKEVKFDDEITVFTFITAAINDALSSKDALPEIKSEGLLKAKDTDLFHLSNSLVTGHEATKQSREDTGFTTVSETQNIFVPNVEDGRETKRKTGEYESNVDGNGFMKTANEQMNINKLLLTMREDAASFETSNTETTNSKHVDFANIMKFDISKLSITGSVFATYITALDDEALYFIDQHAAHERIFYEQLLNQYKTGEKLQQLLMIPFVVNVSYAVKEGFNRINALYKMGFEIEEFGAKAFIVKAVPLIMAQEDSKEFLEQFLENVDELTDFENNAAIEKIIINACKSAVKANDELAMPEMRQLLLDLSKCENPYNCPHGRPTFIKLTKNEIEKMFKRK